MKEELQFTWCIHFSFFNTFSVFFIYVSHLIQSQLVIIDKGLQNDK